MTYVGRGVDAISNVEKLDNITFDGSTTYNLTKSSVAFTPSGANNILISIDGVVQQGNFSVAGATIIMDWSPTSNNTCNWIQHYGTGVLNVPADGSVNMAQLGASGTKSSSTYLAGDNTFKTISGTTINTNADNRVITGSGTANTLTGEANLTYDGTQLVLTDGTEGTDNLLVKTTADGSISMAVEKSDMKFDIGLDYDNAGSQNFYIRERHQGGSNTNAVRLLIDSAGKVGIGETAPLGNLHVKSADSGAGASAGGDELVVEGSAHSGISVLSGTTSQGSIYFGDSGDNDIAGIVYNHNNNNLTLRSGGLNTVNIDGTGAMTKPYQPSFSAYAGSGQLNQPATTWITGEFDTEIFDVNADYNNSTYTFTAPVTGKYLFTVMWTVNSFTGRCYSYFNTSNRNYTQSYYTPVGGGGGSFTGSTIADMDASDTCKWQVYAYDDSAWDLQGYYFTGTLLS